jgi:hypothetical protein
MTRARQLPSKKQETTEDTTNFPYFSPVQPGLLPLSTTELDVISFMKVLQNS